MTADNAREIRRRPGAHKEHCLRGHPMTGDNVRIRVDGPYERRICKSCVREDARRYYDREKNTERSRRYRARKRAESGG